MNLLPRSSTTAVVVLAAALCVSASGGAVAGSLITGKNIKDDSITTKDVKDGTLRTADLSAATLAKLGGTTTPGAARAYARVDGTAVTLQSGGITATYPKPGRTCVTVPGLSSATTPALVSLDYFGDSTGTTLQAYAQVATAPTGCPAGSYRVESFTRSSGGAMTPSQEPFVLVVP